MIVPHCTHIVLSILFSLVLGSTEAVATDPFKCLTCLNQTELNAWKNRRQERRAALSLPCYQMISDVFWIRTQLRTFEFLTHLATQKNAQFNMKKTFVNLLDVSVEETDVLEFSIIALCRLFRTRSSVDFPHETDRNLFDSCSMSRQLLEAQLAEAMASIADCAVTSRVDESGSKRISWSSWRIILNLVMTSHSEWLMAPTLFRADLWQVWLREKHIDIDTLSHSRVNFRMCAKFCIYLLHPFEQIAMTCNDMQWHPQQVLEFPCVKSWCIYGSVSTVSGYTVYT